MKTGDMVGQNRVKSRGIGLVANQGEQGGKKKPSGNNTLRVLGRR